MSHACPANPRGPTPRPLGRDFPSGSLLRGRFLKAHQLFLDLFLAASFPLAPLLPFPRPLPLLEQHCLSWGRARRGNLLNFPSDGQVALLSPLSSAPRLIVCSVAFPLLCDVCCRSLVGGPVGNGSVPPTWPTPPCASPAPRCESPSPLGTAGTPCLLFRLFR